MKKLASKLPTFLLGTIVGITLTAGSVVGAATYLKATQSNVKLVVDGTQAKLTESPLNVNGKLYLPVRDTADAFGYSVQSVTSSTATLKENTASNNTSGSTANKTTNVSNNGVTTTASKSVKNLKEAYSTDGKLDADKIRTALNNGSLDVNAVDSITGNSLLHLVILEDNFEAYKAIKRNALNVNIQNNEGVTALMVTVQNQNSFYFGEMKASKADPDIQDKSGKKAIDYADPKSTFYDSLRIYMF
ncbi:MAG: stalk domain-containing protein [Bacillota bacterium]